jgi:hypothetical protein
MIWLTVTLGVAAVIGLVAIGWVLAMMWKYRRLFP